MQEIELKFQVPAARRAALLASLGEALLAQRLQAAYFDTADRALARAGVALRLRREGRRWVQTVKAAGDDGMTRPEHNALRAGASAAPPALDLVLHEGTPAGARLAAALAGQDAAALACLFRTDIRRRVRTRRSGGALLELAFDEGRILAGDRQLPVCELEIELKRGPLQGLFGAARRQVQRHGLWLDTRSKAERGDLLARGETVAPERKAGDAALAAAMTRRQARRAVLASCLDQIAPNASQIASGEFRDEHVHQLRVGLRRLRTALRLFDGNAASPLSDAAASLFGRLGAARDQAAVGAPLQRELQGALDALGLALQAPGLPGGSSGDDDPVALLRAAPAQTFLLDLLAELHDPAGPTAADEADEAPLRKWLGARLNRWHRQVADDAPRFATLDDAARHRLRKRAKRLRYAVEFGAALYEPKRVRRYLAPLRALQERLGELNDVVVALDAFRGGAPDDAARAFALGWLAARRAALAVQCEPALAGFAAAKRFWKR